MNEIITFGLGVLSCLVVILFITGMVMLFRLNSKVRDMSKEMDYIHTLQIPEIKKSIETYSDHLHRVIDDAKKDLYTEIKDIYPEIEKTKLEIRGYVDRRFDKLKEADK